MHRPFRWLLAGLLYSLADRVMPQCPRDPAAVEAGETLFLSAAAENFGAGQARKQLSAVEIAKHLALGDRADTGGRRETPITTKRHSND